ncbi:MAG TPA: cytochrome c biogenesis protein CcsA [Saprospiraceae bacterium]|nr:cytochrome c biogenesis protein CcsA [Saprospiraceae bacterium]
MAELNKSGLIIDVYQFMRKSWWKMASVLLLSYVLIRGLLTPLKPGIVDCHPLVLWSGKAYSLDLELYNSKLKSGQGHLKAFLLYEDTLFCQVEEILIHSENELTLTGRLPAPMPDKLDATSLTVVLDNEQEGVMILPSKLVLRKGSEVTDTLVGNLGLTAWQKLLPGMFHYQRSVYYFPYRNILYETIRNTFFHVPMWFSMFLLLALSVIASISFLYSRKLEYDILACSLIEVAIVFGILGLITGSIWAKFTWGSWWTRDIKLNMSALTLLIYFAYLILRMAIPGRVERATISSAYAILALVCVIPMVFILPRLTSSLHPGNGGNPAFGQDDMDNSLRLVFYPAVLGFMLLAVWIALLHYRVKRLELNKEEEN